MGLSLIWGYSTFHGTYTCTSNRTLTVEVEGSCKSKGLQVGIGVQYDTSILANVPAIPGAKACNADDLLKESEFAFASAKAGFGASKNSDDSTGYVSVGFTAGLGVGRQKCKTRRWKPIIIHDDPLRWAM